MNRSAIAIGFVCCLAAARSAPAEGPATAPAESRLAREVMNSVWYHSDHVAQLADPDPIKDPLQPIAEQMEDVVGKLTAQETDQPVQTEQKQCLASLDVIIKELEEQTKSGGSGSNPNPTKPMTKSVIAGGPGGSGPLHDAQAGTNQWGQLPPKDRDQILQSQTEGFPPGYESVLASYYSRLAQMEVAPDAQGSATLREPQGPATQPAQP